MAKTFTEALTGILENRYGAGTLGEAAAVDVPPTKIPSFIKRVTFAGTSQSRRWTIGSRQHWQEPDYDFSLIDKAVYTDSFLRRAIDKYEELFWKNGYKIVTTSDEVNKYLRLRMVLHTFATGQPFDEFLRQVSRELIKYHNVILYKKRFDMAKVGPIGRQLSRKIQPLGEEQFPVGGYEIIPLTTVRVKKDEKNNLTTVKQISSNGKELIFNLEEVIHIKKACEAGQFWGNPFIQPVLEDIKAYRQLEEDAIVISHQMIEPKIIYKVGDTSLPSTIVELDEAELSRIVNDLQYMLESGAIVIPGSHEVNMLDTRATQDISNYMEMIKMRVFGGLGMSPVHFGEAGSANRSVTDRLDVQMYDTVKGYQATTANYLTYYMFAEWLIEGGFDVDFSLQDDEDWAYMEFEEIDTDSLIKKQNHETSQFVQNAITHDEMRRNQGRLPLTDEQAKKLYADMIGAIDAKHKETVDKAAAQKVAGGTSQGSNSKTKVKKTSSDDGEVLKENLEEAFSGASSSMWWHSLKEQILEYIANRKSYVKDKEFDVKEIEQVLEYSFDKISNEIKNTVKSNLVSGISAGKNQALMAGYSVPPSFDSSSLLGYLSTVTNRVESSVSNLKTILSTRIAKDIRMSDMFEEQVSYIEASFNGLEYKLPEIERSEGAAAYNYGILSMATLLKIESVWRDGQEDCEVCVAGKENVKYKTIEDIPPLSTHPNCECKLRIV